MFREANPLTLLSAGLDAPIADDHFHGGSYRRGFDLLPVICFSPPVALILSFAYNRVRRGNKIVFLRSACLARQPNVGPRVTMEAWEVIWPMTALEVRGNN